MKLISCLALSVILVCSCGKSGGSSNPNGSNNPNDPNNPDNPNVPTYTQMKQLSTGINYACGLDLNSNVRCVGQNYSGQFGDGTTNDAQSASTIQKISGAFSVSSAAFIACTLKNNGSLWCTGKNTEGGLGDGTNGGLTAKTYLRVQGIY